LAQKLSRVCSECPTPLGLDSKAKTCSTKCRGRRSRRLKRTRETKTAGAIAANTLPDQQRALSEVVTAGAPEIAHEVIREELRPVVREALTDDVLRAVKRIVALTPEAIEMLSEDLASDDALVRQKAYTLILKYTVGNNAIVAEERDPQGLIVNFSLPRPSSGGVTPEDGDTVSVEAVELRTCHMCNQEKPLPSFIANSDRCEDCYEAMQLKAREILGE
jgi:hypothetical protein